MYGENGAQMRTTLAALLRQHRVMHRLAADSSTERAEVGQQILRFRRTLVTWGAQAIRVAQPLTFPNIPQKSADPFRATNEHGAAASEIPAPGQHPSMDKLVQSLGITSLSNSPVSEMARELDAHVEQFRTRSLAEAGPCTFVIADALVLKVHEGGRVVPGHALVATGVNADGHREILGLQVTSSEDGAGRLAFFRI